MKNTFFKVLIVSSLLIVFVLPLKLRAQEQGTRDNIENVLRQFKNWRFGTVSLYEIRNLAELRRALKSKDEATSTKVSSDCVEKANPEERRIVEEGVASGKSYDDIIMDFLNKGLPPPEDLQCIYDVIRGSGGAEEQQIERAYLVTTRSERNSIPNTVIALIVSYDDSENIKRNLRSVQPSNIYSIRELKDEALDESFRSRTLYDLMLNALIQGNVDNKTLEAQGIGSDIYFAPRVYGITSSLALDDNDLYNQDIQQFLRISEAQPIDYIGTSNELIISPDLISWRMYEPPYEIDRDGNFVVDSNGNYVIDQYFVTNDDLPSFGLELKYGLEDLNYPSIWSERLTLNAVMKNVKFGVILPTGWFGDDREILSQERRLTYGGVGIAGSMDFPVKIIPQSGLFKFSFGYVFGDAVQSKYKNRNLSDPSSIDPLINLFDNDYLIRANAQLHYTFGVKIDEDYSLRFGVLGSVYNVEKWFNRISEDSITGDRSLSFSKLDNEVIGGISGKVEFMATNVSWPYGASAQYFDEGIGANVWLHIPLPIMDNRMALRLDAKAYFAAFKNTPRAWESKSLFIPMARLIFNF
ncbi:MAG: hypothetical protein GX121_00615 [Ignavibacteria bacterium]|nr:hypothetical protein [Ignavibacteria bacterium]